MTAQLPSPAKRQTIQIFVIALFLLLIALAATVPFVWESKSLWYKIGMDKTLLQLGKVAGLSAALFFFFQILLALRLRFFDKLCGLDRVYYLHRLCGMFILLLATLHAALVLIPEGIKNLPIGRKFWPEMLGMTIFSLLVPFVGAALFKRKLLPYNLWRKVHRPFGYLLLGALCVHIFFVSDSFEQTVPRTGLWLLIISVAVVAILANSRRFIALHTRHSIKECCQVNADVVSVRVEVPQTFRHAPGQFAFLELYGENISREPHPFTIASAPDNDDENQTVLQFFIKKCGDWTQSLDTKIIQKASVFGPFGLFSYKARPLPSSIVFIAGGIGITPFLSMLRQLGREKQAPDIMLIWSLSRKTDMFLHDELELLKQQLKNFRVHIFFTREQGGRRLDREMLKDLLGSIGEKTHFYICGPQKMLARSRSNLKDLGFSSKSIFWEKFAL